jgi:aldose 1-epimerase
LVSFAPHWEALSLSADHGAAEAVSRLEFWRYPDWMAQFPFAHTITITHRLSEGTLEVRALIENHAREPMPISLGFHPYFRIADAPRNAWTVHLAARRRYALSKKLLPTGDSEPIDWPDPLPLAGQRIDDVLGDIAPGDEFWVQGAKQRITVRYGARYPVAIVYAPPGRDFICFEPMTGLTNAFNMAHAGKYDALESIPPGGCWQESFWIRPSGY